MKLMHINDIYVSYTFDSMILFLNVVYMVFSYFLRTSNLLKAIHEKGCLRAANKLRSVGDSFYSHPGS